MKTHFLFVEGDCESGILLVQVSMFRQLLVGSDYDATLIAHKLSRPMNLLRVVIQIGKFAMTNTAFVLSELKCETLICFVVEGSGEGVFARAVFSAMKKEIFAHRATLVADVPLALVDNINVVTATLFVAK